MVTYEVEGLKEALSAIDDAPARLKKIVDKAFKEGGKVASRSVRQKTPKRWKKLVRYKVEKSLRGNTSALIGYFNSSRGTRGKKEMPDWFKAYWKNYGTLSHRDPSHKFDNPIKPHVKRRNNVGQYPEHFFETAMERMEDAFMQKVEEVLKANEDQILSK